MSVVAASIDQREPKHLQRLTFGGVPVDVSLLPTGDYLLVADDGTLVGCERKTVSDFLGTLANRDRLFDQLRQLKELTNDAYLALVGDLRRAPDGTCYVDGMKREWNWESIRWAKVRIQQMGIVILELEDDKQLEGALRHICDDPHRPMRLNPIRETGMMSDQEAILSLFPGIGPEKSHAILEECGDLKTAICWLSLPDRECEGVIVAGVRDGSKRKFWKVLGLESDEYLKVEKLPVRSNKEEKDV